MIQNLQHAEHSLVLWRPLSVSPGYVLLRLIRAGKTGRDRVSRGRNIPMKLRRDGETRQQRELLGTF